MYLFFPQEEITSDLDREILAIPGVQRIRGGFRCSTNCAFLVLDLLNASRVLFRVRKDSVIARTLAKDAIPSDLFSYQRDFLMRFAYKAGALAEHPPGAGKTRTAIEWARFGEGPTIVVTKAAALGTWAEEIAKFGNGVNCVLLTPALISWLTTPMESRKESRIVKSDKVQHGVVSKRNKTQLKAAQVIRCEASRIVLESGEIIPVAFFIVSWESLRKVKDWILSQPFVSAIFDEGHKAQSHKRWRAVPVADGQKADRIDGNVGLKFERKDNMSSAADLITRHVTRRIVLTATPLFDRPRNYYGILTLVEPNCWGNYYSWATRYCAGHQGTYGFEDRGISHSDELKRRMAFTRHVVTREQTYKALPPLRFQSVYIPHEEQQTIDMIKEELAESSDRQTKSSMLERQLAIACAKKRPVVIDTLKSLLVSNTKVLLFTGRVRELENLRNVVSKELPNIDAWFASGETPPKLRDDIRHSYMAHPGPCLLVGTNGAWGESVNLQDTDVALVTMLPYSPGQLLQMIGRVYRQGLLRKPLIQFLIAEDTIDEHVNDMVLKKVSMLSTLTDAGTLKDAQESISYRNEEEMTDRLLEAIGIDSTTLQKR